MHNQLKYQRISGIPGRLCGAGADDAVRATQPRQCSGSACPVRAARRASDKVESCVGRRARARAGAGRRIVRRGCVADRPGRSRKVLVARACEVLRFLWCFSFDLNHYHYHCTDGRVTLYTRARPSGRQGMRASESRARAVALEFSQPPAEVPCRPGV